MKKFFTLMLLMLFCINNTYAYDLSNTDVTLIKNFAIKGEQLIKKRVTEGLNEANFRKMLSTQILALAENYKNNDRVYSVFKAIGDKLAFKCGENLTVTINGETIIYQTKLMADGKCWTKEFMRHLPYGATSHSTDKDTANGTIGNSWKIYCSGSSIENCGGVGVYSIVYDYYNAVGSLDGTQTQKGVCGQLGVGWKLPSNGDYNTLIDSLGGSKLSSWNSTHPNKKLGGLMNILPGYFNNEGNLQGKTIILRTINGLCRQDYNGSFYDIYCDTGNAENKSYSYIGLRKKDGGSILCVQE